MRTQQVGVQPPAWSPIFWHLADAKQEPRRTLAMPDETVGAIMQRALEEASVWGYISEEDAFSKSLKDNWSAFLLVEGEARPLQLSLPLAAYEPEGTIHLIFRANNDEYHLRAAPLRLSLEGIEPLPADPPKRSGTPVMTSLLLVVIIALLGVCVWLLLQPKKTTTPTPDTRNAQVESKDAGSPQTAPAPRAAKEKPTSTDAGTTPERPPSDQTTPDDSDDDDSDDDDSDDDDNKKHKP